MLQSLELYSSIFLILFFSFMVLLLSCFCLINPKDHLTCLLTRLSSQVHNASNLATGPQHTHTCLTACTWTGSTFFLSTSSSSPSPSPSLISSLVSISVSSIFPSAIFLVRWYSRKNVLMSSTGVWEFEDDSDELPSGLLSFSVQGDLSSC